ncbi:MAG: manno-octulosonate cytidylyltransferase [Pseudomonadota bacterium]
MSVWIIIPARYASTRFPGKPLQPLTGADGVTKSLIHRTWEAGQAVQAADRVIVATDDDRIAEAVRSFGGEVAMTSPAARNGTERCAEAVAVLDGQPDIVVNLQGDAPLTPPWFLEDLVAGLRARPEMGAATPVLLCDAQTYRRLREDRMAGRVGGTTAVFASDHRALYFSKEVIPFLPDPHVAAPPVWHHVGVYAYRPASLHAYAGWPEGPLERSEGLEQLRFLENGEGMLCVPVDARGRVFWELNNPVDITRIEAVL